MASSAASIASTQAAAIARAIKASGAIVSVDPDDFVYILRKGSRPIVIMATGGIVRVHYQYMTTYRGFVFYTKSRAPLALPGDAEIIAANKIWVPG